MRKKKNGYELRFLDRPGRVLSDLEVRRLCAGFYDVASSCFDSVPGYQVMEGTREALSDKVIAYARRPDGTMAGFCSTVLLPVPGVGRVLHLGLTCVKPEDRRHGLTHLLTRKAVTGFLMRQRPVGRVWMSNCAAVLSSLGNVAMHFDGVYPSPFRTGGPHAAHLAIARAIDAYHRDKIYIDRSAEFDETRFVFRASVKGTVFQKAGDDTRYLHRLEALNTFYRDLMDFGNGDEVLQVGHVSTLSAVRHAVRRRKQLRARAIPRRQGGPDRLAA